METGHIVRLPSSELKVAEDNRGSRAFCVRIYACLCVLCGVMKWFWWDGGGKRVTGGE